MVRIDRHENAADVRVDFITGESLTKLMNHGAFTELVEIDEIGEAALLHTGKGATRGAGEERQQRHSGAKMTSQMERSG